MCVTHLLIMHYLSVKFHQICFSSLLDIAEKRFVTDGQTDGANLICHLKFLQGHKNIARSTTLALSSPSGVGLILGKTFDQYLTTVQVSKESSNGSRKSGSLYKSCQKTPKPAYLEPDCHGYKDLKRSSALSDCTIHMRPFMVSD